MMMMMMASLKILTHTHSKINTKEKFPLDGDDGDYPAYSHHDKIPPWWGNVSNDKGGNVSVSKTHHTPIHHDELYFEVYMYQVTHITSVSFGINF